MAKNYKDNFKDVDGVWRTVGGRRIFIRNGQDLASAMIESGKFKNLRSAVKLDKLKKEEKEKLKNLKEKGILNEENKEDIENARKELVDVYKDRKQLEKEIINPIEEYSDTNGKGMTDAQEKILNAVKTSFLYKDEGEMSSGLQKNYELYGKENVDSALKYYEDNYELIKGVASDSEGLTYNDLIKKDEYPENALKYYKNQMEELKNSGLQYKDSKAYNDKADALKEELEKSKEKSKYRTLESLEQDVEYDKAHGIDTESRDYLDSIYNKAHEKLDKEYKDRYTKDKVMSKAEYEKELANDPNKDDYADASYEAYLSSMEDAGHDVSKFKDAVKEYNYIKDQENYVKGLYDRNAIDYDEFRERMDSLSNDLDRLNELNSKSSNTLKEVRERMTIESKLNGTNTNNQELYNKYMKDADKYDQMKAKYDKQEKAYKEEYNRLEKEWHKYEYGTPEYEKVYKELTKYENQHYNETKDMRDKLFKQKEIKALEEQGEKVVFDSKGNLLFHPSYYDKDATRKIDFGIDVNSPTAIKDKQILDSVTGQLSDGIWENSPGQNKYWSNMNYEQHNNRITFATSERGKYDEYSHRYIANPFSSKSDQEVKDYVANKIKQIAKIEMKDDSSAGTWDRNNTSRLNYLGYDEGITVADAYNLYDRLKGRTPKVQNSINDDIRRKAYQKYLKEHPGSKMTFNDFMK